MKPRYFMIAAVFFISACTAGRAVIHPAPELLPFTEEEMTDPDFWISRHPSPETTILTFEEISRLNAGIRTDLKLTKDIFQLPSHVSGDELVREFTQSVNDLERRHLFKGDGQKTKQAYFVTMQYYMTSQVPEQVRRQYGIIVRFSDQKFLPTEEILTEKPGDVEFDELQNSALDIGTPVAVVWTTADGKWSYVETDLSDGWVKSEYVAIGSKEAVLRFAKTGFFAIVTAAKADLYADAAMTRSLGRVRMGIKFPLERSIDGNMAAVKLPQRNSDGRLSFITGYMHREDVYHGYLTYTPRMIIQQAFKLLGHPYGWGGINGGQDCSRFIQEVFATVGIEMPRDSVNQRQVGQVISTFADGQTGEDKLAVIREQGIGGITLLGIKGHIMLYLGTWNDRAYAIHAVWAYRQPGTADDEIYVIDRVVVSDLSLGEGSQKGSWLKRIISVGLLK